MPNVKKCTRLWLIHNCISSNEHTHSKSCSEFSNFYSVSADATQPWVTSWRCPGPSAQPGTTDCSVQPHPAEFWRISSFGCLSLILELKPAGYSLSYLVLIRSKTTSLTCSLKSMPNDVGASSISTLSSELRRGCRTETTRYFTVKCGNTKLHHTKVLYPVAL